MASDGISGSVDTLNIQIRVDGVERATRDLDGLARSLNDLQMISNLMTGQAIIDDAQRQAGEVKSLGNEAEKTSGKVSKFQSTISKLGSSFKKASSPLGNFAAALKRIAMYRFMRSIIRAITTAVSEGITNIYHYSQAVGTSLAPALDRAKSATLTFKNSIGAALAPVLESVLIPALVKVCEWLTKFNNLLAAFFAGLAGKDSYTAAVEATATWGDNLSSAAGAAKELKRQLLGFDELNILNDSSSGGGGGGGKTTPDYASMFEERNLPESIKNVTEMLREVFSDLTDVFTLAFSDIKLDTEYLKQNKEALAELVIMGICTAIGLLWGGLPGAAIGFTIGAKLSESIFDKDGQISREEWEHLAEILFGTIGGGLAGLAIGGVPGMKIGAAVGFALTVLASKTEIDGDGTTLADIFFTPKAVQIAWEKLTKWWDENVHPWREKQKEQWGESPIGSWVTQAWEDIKKAFKDFAGFFLGEDGQFSIENIFGIKVGEGFDSLPSDVQKKMNEIKTNLTTGWGKIQSWWNTTASPKLSSIWDTVSGWWDEFVDAPTFAYDSVYNTVSTKGGQVVQTGTKILSQMPTNIVGIWDMVRTQAGPKWEEIKGNLKTKAEGAKENVITAFQNLPGKVGEIWEQVKSFFKDPFKGTNAGNKATEVKQTIVGAFQNMPTNISGIWQQVRAYFTNPFNGTNATTRAEEIKSQIVDAFEKMKKSVGDIWEQMQNNIKTPINAIIGFINKLLFGVVSGMNKMISKLNSLSFTIPQWVSYLIPGAGGHTLKFNISNLGYPPQINYLAGGGIVQEGQLFVARERGPELVGSYGSKTGVLNNEQIVDAVSAGVYRAVVEAMGDQSTTVNIDGKTLFEIVTERNNSQVRRTGRSPLLV